MKYIFHGVYIVIILGLVVFGKLQKEYIEEDLIEKRIALMEAQQQTDNLRSQVNLYVENAENFAAEAKREANRAYMEAERALKFETELKACKKK